MEELSIDYEDSEIANIDDAFNVTNIHQSLEDSSGDENNLEHFKRNQYHLNKLEIDLAELTKERLGKMENFTVHLYHFSTNEYFDTLKSCDLCSIIEQYKNLDIKIYFDKKHSQLTAKELAMDHPPILSSKEILLRSLQESAVAGCDTIISNGGIRKTTGEQKILNIKCSCNRLTRAIQHFVYSDYRQDTYSNNRRNNRQGLQGRRGKKRRGAILSKDKDALCPFSIPVYQDCLGYYVRSKFTHPYHETHPRRDHIRVREKLVHGDDMEAIKDSTQACALSGTGRNIYYVRSRRKQKKASLLSTRQVSKICHDLRKKRKLAENVSGDANGDIDDLYRILQTKKYSYVSLFQVKTEQLDVINDTNTPERNSEFHHTLLTEYFTNGKYSLPVTGLSSDQACYNEANQYVTLNREARRIKDDQEMLVALAFASPFQLKQHSLFPEVIHIDCSSDTNNEGRPLLKVTAKDSNGKFFTACNCYLPNERAWSFKWFFTEVFTKLCYPSAIDRTKFVITDGDFVCIGQLEEAISTYMPHVRRGRCSWHIVDRGWAEKVRLPLGGYSNRKRESHLKGKRRRKVAPLTIANKMGRVFYRWLFSWAQSEYCMDEDEFNVSKTLFLYLLNHKDVKEIFKEEGCSLIKNFYNENVYPHLNYMLFYLRAGMFNLEAHANVGGEGVFNGIKNGAAPVTPMNRLDRSVEIIAFGEEVKNQEIMTTMCRRTSEDKNWSNSPTSRYLTDVSESILLKEWFNGKRNYKVSRRNKTEWYVMFNSDEAEEIQDPWEGWNDEDTSIVTSDENPQTHWCYMKKFGLIPRFRRCYKVNLCETTSVLKCSCQMWDRMKLPCRHLSAVIHNNSFLCNLYPDGFPLSSVGCRWMNCYYYYGMNHDNLYSSIQKRLRKLIQNDSKGLYCPLSIPEELDKTFDSDFLKLYNAPAKERVLNYSQRQMDLAFPDSLHDEFNAIYSQDSFLNNGNDENPLFDIPDPELPYKERLKALFFKTCDEIDFSGRNDLAQEFEKVMNDLLLRAREDDVTPSGKRVSMYGRRTEKRKTHGTAHYK